MPTEGGVHNRANRQRKAGEACPLSNFTQLQCDKGQTAPAVLLQPQTFFDGLTTAYQDLPPGEKKKHLLYPVNRTADDRPEGVAQWSGYCQTGERS